MADTYTVEIKSEEGYILATILPGFTIFDRGNTLNPSHMSSGITKEINDALNGAKKPTAVILDTRDLSINFTELVMGMLGASRDEETFFNHPNVRYLALISHNDLLKFGANAMGQSQYGEKKVHVFDTLDAAISAARTANV